MPIARVDLMLAAMGAPHLSSQTTSLLRLAGASLARGAEIRIWTCGYATMLTAESLGASKPRNVLDWGGSYPSTPSLARELLATYPGSVSWLACRFCSDERGATPQIPEVRLETPMRFGTHMAAAGKTIFFGVV